MGRYRRYLIGLAIAVVRSRRVLAPPAFSPYRIKRAAACRLCTSITAAPRLAGNPFTPFTLLALDVGRVSL